VPELPEVQTVVNQLRPLLLGKRLKSITPIWPKVFHNFKNSKIQKTMNGRMIINVTRRAKFIIIEFKDNIIAVHLRMTGKLYLQSSKKPLPKYTSAYFSFDSDKILIFDDVRKFGRIYFYKTITPIDSRHGPEPLADNFNVDTFTNLFKTKRRNIKGLLLDQKVLAGLGNIYVDESLWASGIHPNSISNLIPLKKYALLHMNIKKILTNSIKQNGTTIIDFSVNGQSGKYVNKLKVYGRKSLNCMSCQNKIKKIRVAGRGTYVCTKCQRKYKSKA
tara:strand:- start:1311 stop:2135 length:825 start_codon:yes stop_codon:yes gene_type:complete